LFEMSVPIATTVEEFPSNEECIAALARQLLRARGARDQIAVWLATNALCSRLCSLLADLLSSEAAWDSERRWLDNFARRHVSIDPPARVRVAGPLIWGFQANPSGTEWAEPFEAELEFSPGLRQLAGFTIRFGDRRAFPGEGLRQSVARIVGDIEGSAVEWAFVFRHPAASA
jgi:hypothetical protein